MLALAATSEKRSRLAGARRYVGGEGFGLLVLAATSEEAESACWCSPLLRRGRIRLAGARRYGGGDRVGLLALAATSEGKEVGYEAVSFRAQTGEVTRMSSLQSTARMSERAESSR